MTEKQTKESKYKYTLNSNLVLQGQNKDGGGSRNNKGQQLPSGEGESLAGKKLAGFGDRIVREKLQDAPENKRQIKQQEKKGQRQNKANMVPKIFDDDQVKKQPGGTNSLANVNFSTIEVSQDLIYRPQMQETKVVYEQILHIISRHLGDSSLETIKDAVDEVLSILMNDEQSNQEQKADIDSLLGGLDNLKEDEFSSLIAMSQQLTDYNLSKDEDQKNARKQEGAQYSNNQQQDIEIDLDDEEEESDDSQVGQVQEEEPEQVEEQIDSSKPNNVVHEETKADDKIEIMEIDAHWLNRKLSETMPDVNPEDILSLESKILAILENVESPARECEKKLFALLSYKRIDLVRTIVKSRHAIFYGILLKQAQSPEEREAIEKQMQSSQIGFQLLVHLNVTKDKSSDILSKIDLKVKEAQEIDMLPESDQAQKGTKVLDLEGLKFNQGARLMANKKCTLPKGSTRLTKPGYEEVYIPAVRQKKSEGEKLVPISSLPAWARSAFPSYMTHLNRIQSRLYHAAFETPENLLVCAPTGAGKTNIAMLSCLQLLGEMRTQKDGKISYNLGQFKIIYIAPMKALVTEVVGNFQARLGSFGIKVKELTGDVHLTKQQIEEANIIVTTPEKWDIITRKSGERAYVDLVKLIIIDEVHLLHDSRGPVLEAIVSRTIKQIEETTEHVRIVGLSATLPNYEDVAALLRVDPTEGLFYFDNTYRPVPLEQVYVGITEKKAIKRMMLMNEICYEKVMERVEKHQVLVFTHSRKETARTAKIIRDMALAQDKLGCLVKDDSESKKILLEVIVEKKLAVSKDVQDLVPYGIGIHHAGLSKDDRTLVEDLFAAGHIKILVSTATLAWGVNLPAHTVILKGTQIYSPEQGKWVELSPQDVLQMMGRAGRPQYDTMGEGIIITNHADLQYYLSLNNQQLPIESQMISSLPDQMNAQIVLGSVSNLNEAVKWLSYTYLYIRMRRNPDLYGIDSQDIAKDPTLIQTRVNLAHTAAIKLQNAGMIKYEQRSGSLLATALGKVGSHYYIKCDSMQVYNEELKPQMGMIDIFRLFALSKEFENIPIRDNEKVELQKFIDRVPVPVKGGIEETATKINILLQAYIARFRLEGYDLNADLVYVTQSAARIMRALFEISIRKGWAQLAENFLNSCKMVERRQWYSMTPLRQFIAPGQNLSFDLNEIAQRIERKDQFRWSDLFDLSAQRLGELIKYPKMGKVVLSYVHKFPRLEISAFVQPITRGSARIELEFKTHEKFIWDSTFHGRAESFWVIVEDGDSEQILHHELFTINESQVGTERHLSFVVPLFDPLPPQYFIKVISDKWLQAEHVVAVSFKNLILPEKYAAPTQLMDMHQKLVQDLDFEEAAQIYKEIDGIQEFSPVQSQAFDKLYQSDSSVFIGVPLGGSEKRILAEMAIFREIQKENFGKIVYIQPRMELCQIAYDQWKERLGENGMGLAVELLQENTFGTQQSDLRTLASADLIICTPAKWDFLSRKWRQRKQILQVGLYILDDLHHLNEQQDGIGATYEMIVSRIRFIQGEISTSQQKDDSIQQKIRIVGLSSPLANSKDISDWLGVSYPECTFNFHPSVRASCPSIGPLQINIQAYDHNQKHQRSLQMAKPTFNMLKRSILPNLTGQAIIFVSERNLPKQVADSIFQSCVSSDQADIFLGCNSTKEQEQLEKKLESTTFQEEPLEEMIQCGIAYLIEGQPLSEIELIKDLYKKGIIRVLVATMEKSWILSDLQAATVIIQNPEKYSSSESIYQELPLTDLLQMQSLAVSQKKSAAGRVAAKCVIMCHSPKKDYFAKFIQEPLPIESCLPQQIHEHLSAEVASGTIESIQDAIDWITWSFLFRRIVKNPNFYEITGRSGQHINDFLSELIENTVVDLAETGCVEVKEDEVGLDAANLGRIASFYYIKYQTIHAFSQAISQSNQKLQKRQILQIISNSAELQSLLETEEFSEQALRIAALNLPIDIDSNADYSDPSTIAMVLLQTHFSRKPIPIDLKAHQKKIVFNTVKLLHSFVDVVSSTGAAGNLRATLQCMEICQMIVQGAWTNQSPLVQLPYFTKGLIEKLKDQAGIVDIADFMNMEDDQREKFVPFSEKQMLKLASVCNRYPNFELLFEGNINKVTCEEGSPAQIHLNIKRDIEEADYETKQEYIQELKALSGPVDAPFYPGKKDEIWWVLIGDASQDRVLSIKKINSVYNQAQIKQVVDFDMDGYKKGTHELQAYLICDSYIGCDLEKKFNVIV